MQITAEQTSTPQTDEEKILAYLTQHSPIDNGTCRKLLDVDKNRASYLLNKMHRAGLLSRTGTRRWMRYHLAD